MKKLSEIITMEFKYDSEEERDKHVKEMESQGYFCNGQRKKSDDPLTSENRTFYWYAHFLKQIK